MHRLAEFRGGGLSVEVPDAFFAGQAVPSQSTRPSVLVVDDEPGRRRYLAEILEGESNVLQARDGAEGLRLALQREPDLVLENVRLERDLAARNARLEQALKDLEHTQAQLIQSEKLNALGNLSAGLLHEINNPLNYTLTALQLLAADAHVQADELLREMVGDIDEGMQRIRVIVTDLRAFAYPSEAQMQGLLDFNEAVEAALRFTAHDLKDFEVVCDLPRPARVMGSKSHLTQVLVNLLTNAAKAITATTDGRHGRIAITAGPRDGRLRVQVIDNGIGMDAATLGRLFDPFFTTRDVGEGMGLGLSICHTIINNHQGQLSVASRVGEGTELAFDLVVADEADA